MAVEGRPSTLSGTSQPLIRRAGPRGPSRRVRSMKRSRTVGPAPDGRSERAQGIVDGSVEAEHVDKPFVTADEISSGPSWPCPLMASLPAA